MDRERKPDERCGEFVPDFAAEAQDLEGCRLPKDHLGYHLNGLENGNYLSWGGYYCDSSCGWCGRCAKIEEIRPEDACAIILDPTRNLREFFV